MSELQKASTNAVETEQRHKATSEQTLESPLPAMMSELQEAMAASVSSAGMLLALPVSKSDVGN